ncbi:hypothetical protein QA811_40270 [Streptomyces sp. B21-102]|uniref:hypothetical protein n=1 Tax=Streptomyces sp. B21-102 TaxID=3039416 RepID=UPI002FF015AB
MTHRQLALFAAPPRILAAALDVAAAAPVAAAWLGGQLTGWAAARGWARRRLSAVRRGLHVLLAVQDTPGAPVPATLIDELTGIGLPARLLHEFLAAHRFAEDDRTPAVDAWFARATAGLPEPMTGQLAHWATPSSPAPLRGHRAPPAAFRAARAHPPRRRIRDLAGVTPVQLREHLAACRLTGTDHTHTASGLRSVFTLLHAHRLIGRNPAVHLRVGAHARTVPLPADTAPIRQALDHPDPARVAITALLAFHALRAGEIRHLTLDDARGLDDGRLHLPGRTVPVSEPVRTRLTAYLGHRTRRWPHTANPHFFVTLRIALSTTDAGLLRTADPLLLLHHQPTTLGFLLPFFLPRLSLGFGGLLPLPHRLLPFLVAGRPEHSPNQLEAQRPSESITGPLDSGRHRAQPQDPQESQ